MSADVEVVIYFEFLRGRQNEIVFMVLSVAAKNLYESFHFESHYSMTSHGSEEKGSIGKTIT